MANSKKKLSFTTPPIPPAWKLDKPYNHNVWLIFFVKVPWITSSPLPVLQTFLRLCKKIIVSSFLESPWQFSWLYVIVTLSTYLIESDNFVNCVSFLFVYELTNHHTDSVLSCCSEKKFEQSGDFKMALIPV